MNLRAIIATRPWILAVLVMLVVGAWLGSGMLERRREAVSAAAEPQAPAAAAATRVQVRTQIAEPVTREISVYGRSAPARSVELRAETDGRVTEVVAERGSQVRAGDVILRLDLRDREARLAQARASVREHQTAYEAQLRLKADSYVSEAQIAETLAKLEAARAELKRAQLDIEYTEVRSPFAGAIQDRAVELGDVVSRSDPVATLVDNTRLIVTGSIAEQDAGYISPGARATAVLVTGETVAGRIRYISPVADEATRTFDVELEVPNPGGKLPAGVTAEMRIPAGETLAQRVPSSLLTLDADGRIGIKTIDAYNRVVFHPIEIVRSESDGVWVAGLPEAANVITLGQGYVAVGEPVDPVFGDEETALAAENLK